jgi:hypothetical protein
MYNINMIEDTLRSEERDFIFSKRGSGVRKVIVLSALIEAYISMLVEQLLLKNKLNSSDKMNKYLYVEIDFLESNLVLSSNECKEIELFIKDRDIAVHKIFKGMSRLEWNELNNRIVEKGRLIVENLENKLFAK